MASTLEKLPPPDEVHRELVETLARVATLRKLLRLSQRAAAAAEQERREQQRGRQVKAVEHE
jgi:hypothetical protein